MRFIGFDANGTDGTNILAFDIDYDDDSGVARKLAVSSLTPEWIEALREAATLGDAAVEALLPDLLGA